ncbi:MAG: CBS domain-containing protein [Candidatus Omnitrophica bacterium]|nr:CBS domain-containing protein [Candidatus Omnitrophota bacterium]MBD3268726.1 CBS domain-containing protein [Candidatus Omnitrophota bacterium]
MKISEVMHKDIIAVKRSTPLKALLENFKGFHGHPLIPVVDDEKKLIGIVNSDNLLDIIRPQKSRLFKNIPLVDVVDDSFDLEFVPSMGQLIIVEDIMETKFVSIQEDESIDKAYRLMRLSKVDRVPVTNKNDELSGIIGIFDIIWEMFKIKGVV